MEYMSKVWDLDTEYNLLMIGKESYSVTELPGNVTVGRYSSIGMECKFMDRGNHLCIENKKCVYTINYNQPVCKKIFVGNDVWIGDGVRVLSGVTIGDGVIVGAGAVVAKDIPPFAVVVGNPGRITRYRFTPEQIKSLQEIKWWDWDYNTVQERLSDFLDIDVFISKYG